MNEWPPPAFEWQADEAINANTAEASLNRRAREGWEFVTAVACGLLTLNYYRRPAPPPAITRTNRLAAEAFFVGGAP